MPPKKKTPTLPKTAGELTPAPYNPRKISDQAGTGLSYSMKEFGDLSGLVFNVRTGHLVAGHQRSERLDPAAAIVNYTAADDDVGTVGLAHIADGERLWPVRFVDWEEIKEKAANLAANNPEIAGEFTDAVNALMAEVAAGMPDVFDQALLADLEASIAAGAKGEEVDGDGTPEYDLSPLLYESYNYVVVFFRNKIDWALALHHFKLKMVRDIGNPKNVGLGHVIDGADYLKRVVVK